MVVETVDSSHHLAIGQKEIETLNTTKNNFALKTKHKKLIHFSRQARGNYQTKVTTLSGKPGLLPGEAGLGEDLAMLKRRSAEPGAKTNWSNYNPQADGPTFIALPTNNDQSLLLDAGQPWRSDYSP